MVRFLSHPRRIASSTPGSASWGVSGTVPLTALSSAGVLMPEHGLMEWGEQIYGTGSGQTPYINPVNVCDGYTRYQWNNLESTQGNYNFATIDADVSRAASRGGRFFIEVFCMWPGHGSLVPNYIMTQTPAHGFYATSVGGTTNDTWIPDWNDNFTLSRMEALFAALMARYGTDDRVGGYMIGMYGEFGEWHITNMPNNVYPGPNGELDVSFTNKRRIVDMHFTYLGTNKMIYTQTTDDYGAYYAMQQAAALNPGVPLQQVIGLWRESLGSTNFDDLNPDIASGTNHNSCNLITWGNFVSATNATANLFDTSQHYQGSKFVLSYQMLKGFTQFDFHRGVNGEGTSGSHWNSYKSYIEVAPAQSPGFTHLRFAMLWDGTTWNSGNTPKFEVFLYGDDTTSYPNTGHIYPNPGVGADTTFIIDPYGSPQATEPIAGQWIVYDIPLSAMGITTQSSVHITDIILQDRKGGTTLTPAPTFYFADIGFSNGPGTPTVYQVYGPNGFRGTYNDFIRNSVPPFPFIAELYGHGNDDLASPAPCRENRQIASYHVSMVGNGNYAGSGGVSSNTPWTSLTATEQSNWNAMNNAGHDYRFEGISLVGQQRITAGVSFTLQHHWVNQGTSIVAEPLTLTWQLRDATGTTILYSQASSLDLRTVPPDATLRAYTDQLTFPSSLAAGTYKLYLVVTAPRRSSWGPLTFGPLLTVS